MNFPFLLRDKFLSIPRIPLCLSETKQDAAAAAAVAAAAAAAVPRKDPRKKGREGERNWVSILLAPPPPPPPPPFSPLSLNLKIPLLPSPLLSFLARLEQPPSPLSFLPPPRGWRSVEASLGSSSLLFEWHKLVLNFCKYRMQNCIGGGERKCKPIGTGFFFHFRSCPLPPPPPPSPPPPPAFLPFQDDQI